MSRSSKIEPIEVKKINPNNTNKSNTNKSNTKSNHIFRKDMEEKITIEQQIRTNIDYDSLLLTHREDVEQIDEIVNLISEILAKGDKRKIYIAGDMLDCEYVKERFRELNNKHIRYVLFILKNNKKKINNIKQYLLRFFRIKLLINKSL